MGGALVTGGGRGLGLWISGRLAARGLRVHVTDVDAAAAAEAATQIGDLAWSSQLDVRDAEACREAARATAERAGSLDVWVNNAGIVDNGVTWEHDEATRRRVMDVNAHGTFNGTIAALELMRPAGRGHIINIVSLAGLVASPGLVLYSASKHAAIAFTLGTLADLRRTGEKGIRLSAVCPDGIWTPMIYDKLDDPEQAPSFSGKLLRPEDVADQVVALLDRPRVVLTIPRRRGAFVRLLDLLPGLTGWVAPLAMADARRKQRRWKRRIEAGQGP